MAFNASVPHAECPASAACVSLMCKNFSAASDASVLLPVSHRAPVLSAFRIFLEPSFSSPRGGESDLRYRLAANNKRLAARCVRLVEEGTQARPSDGRVKFPLAPAPRSATGADALWLLLREDLRRMTHRLRLQRCEENAQEIRKSDALSAA